MRLIMSRNAKQDKTWTYRRYPYNPSRRQLRNTMRVPVVYQQLKWEKLKLEKARCVCVCVCVLPGAKGGQLAGPLWGRGVIREPQPLFCENMLAPGAQTCLVPTLHSKPCP